VAVDLSKLNPPQREAAGHGGGPILVLAGAGSGKTRVITFRIAHLLAQGIPARAICAVTFTNKAAEEMRERIAKLLGDKKLASELTIGTFHALGLTILRTERKALGYPLGFAIYDQSDQMGALREAMRHIHDGEGVALATSDEFRRRDHLPGVSRCVFGGMEEEPEYVGRQLSTSDHAWLEEH
jgi:DNA helicase-2/ATP-dependent DNA helicase PcrA